MSNSSRTALTPFLKPGSEQTYLGTATWNSTAPSSTTTHTYQFIRYGNIGFLRINLKYATIGVTNSTLTMTWPVGVPIPSNPTGFSSASNAMLMATATMVGSLTGTTTAAVVRAFIMQNAGGTAPQIGVYSGTAFGALVVQVTMIYWTS